MIFTEYYSQCEKIRGQLRNWLTSIFRIYPSLLLHAADRKSICAVHSAVSIKAIPGACCGV